MTIKQLFIGKTEDSRIQIVRNIIVESIRIGVNALVLFILTSLLFGKEWLSVNTVVASMVSGLLNFALSTIWVFHKRQNKGNISRFIVFTLIGAVGLALNAGITVFLTNCGIHYLVSNLIAQAVVFFFNFFMRKKIVYTMMSKEEASESEEERGKI